MMKILASFLSAFSVVIFLSTLLACSKSRENSTPAKFDVEVIEQASEEFCGESQVLYEDTKGITLKFKEICKEAVLFGFKSGKNKCAITKNISDSWPTADLKNYTFEIKILGDCLPNGSLWQSVSCESDDDKQIIKLHEVGIENAEVIEIKASNEASASYARDHAGLRMFKCKDK